MADALPRCKTGCGSCFRTLPVENVRRMGGLQSCGILAAASRRMEADMSSAPTNPIPELKFAKDLQWTKESKQKFMRPTAFEKVDKAGADEIVILWRGSSWLALEGMASGGSLGGEKADENANAPTPEEASKQVGKGGDSRLPEFTCKTTVAESFSQGGALVLVAVKKKYLANGSGVEEGWVAKKNAPFAAMMWTPGKPGKRLSVDAT